MHGKVWILLLFDCTWVLLQRAQRVLNWCFPFVAKSTLFEWLWRQDENDLWLQNETIGDATQTILWTIEETGYKEQLNLRKGRAEGWLHRVLDWGVDVPTSFLEYPPSTLRTRSVENGHEALDVWWLWNLPSIGSGIKNGLTNCVFFFSSCSVVAVSVFCPAVSLYCVWFGANTQLCRWTVCRITEITRIGKIYQRIDCYLLVLRLKLD